MNFTIVRIIMKKHDLYHLVFITCIYNGFLNTNTYQNVKRKVGRVNNFHSNTISYEEYNQIHSFSSSTVGFDPSWILGHSFVD
jgi:hypothetical protein